MKKVLKIGGILIVVIIAAMIAIPFLFKSKIKNAVINAANENLNATISINDFGLNLFSNFPNATLSLDDAVVVGKGDFSADTLLQAKSASVTINLMSLFGSNYDISKINLDNASMLAKVLPDGRANWDIVMTDSAKTNSGSEKSNPFNLSLNKISVSNCNIVYQNDSTNMKLVMNGWNGKISGDFSADETTLKTTSTIDNISFYMNKIPYILKVKGVAEAELSANFDQMKFTFINSNLQLNDLSASVDGYFAMVGEDGMDFDLKLNAPATGFKQILSVIPAMYTDDFKNIKTEGSATLSAYVKGMMKGDDYPAFDISAKISDAKFQYPSLPKSVNNINADMTINSKGGSLDNVIIDLSKLTFTIGGNPFHVKLNVTTPISDANLKLKADGTLDLSMIKEVYPLEKGTELNGKLTADIDIQTRMSAIEKGQYENVSASGHLNINDMLYKSSGSSDVQINKAGLEFTPRYVNLSSFDVKIGKNDIVAGGRLENLIGYIVKNQTLKGQLSLSSNYLNLNDFMGDDSNNTTYTANDTTDVFKNKIVIPKNIDFTMDANLKHVLYDNLDIKNMKGGIIVRDGVLSLSNVNADLLGGTCKITGSYNTSNPAKPLVDFSLDLSNLSFAQTFKSVETVQKLAPIFENMQGTYSMNFKFNTAMGSSLLETLGGLTGSGGLLTNNVEIENNKTLSALASALNVTSLKTISPKNLNIPFSVENGRINTKPFNVNFGEGGIMKLEGSTGLDESINYKGTVTLPKQYSNKYIENLPFTIGGTFTNPKIGIDSKALANNAINKIADNLLGGNKADSTKTSIGNKINAEILKQAQNIRNQAQESSDKLIKIAEDQAAKLENEAGSNPIAKAAAKAAGKKLVDEAKKQGQNLIDKAEDQAKKLESGAADK